MYRTSLLTFIFASTALSAAHADSFAVNEYSASDLGRANTGRVTQTDDPAAAFGNPALMTAFEKAQVSLVASGILGNAKFDDDGSTDALGNPLGGNTDGFLTDNFIPSGHLVYPLNDRVALGFSVTVPFGLSTDYDRDWPGRYQALTSELQTINLNPSIAYELTDTLSIGGGVSAQYIDARLTSAVDFGAVCFNQVDPVTCAGAGVTPQMADGRIEVEGNDWSYGWNAGLAWTPHPDWLIGLHYRSGIDQDLEGDASFIVPANASFLTANGAFTDTGGQAGLDLPASTELGVRWQATERTTLYANAQWSEWSSLEELRVQFDSPIQPDSVEELNYDDAGRYGFGGDYELNDQWTVRAGYAFDESPARPGFRTARIPDNDRHIFAVGTTWTPNEAWSIDAGYNRVTIEDADFDRTGNYGDRVVGTFSGHADVMSVSATRSF
ncbi:OmpP1/FadL family transporter [Henriciella aquimarina]|uniref:OmpP1/FadL family transporter n=1 Tax=Henriciella aquimarina TaxID=545261 RepID=UPI001301EAFC|nr:outer membrane protein transport protein [Henriciella aquimarina]